MANLVQELEKHFPKIKKFEFPKIKYPKEIELMEELNKQNREEYKRWLFKRKLIDKFFPYLDRKNFPRAYIAA